jgi:hypothetical protein
VRVRETERKLAEAERQHKSDLDSARARKIADYELQVDEAETARDEAVRSAGQAKGWGEDVVSKIRLERDEALSERDSANGKATAALEEARQIKRHAELLDETAREIAREAGRTPTAATPPAPPLPPPNVGFRQVGRRERIGQLVGIWRDTLLLERRSNLVGR